MIQTGSTLHAATQAINPRFWSIATGFGVMSPLLLMPGYQVTPDGCDQCKGGCCSNTMCAAVLSVSQSNVRTCATDLELSHGRRWSSSASWL